LGHIKKNTYSKRNKPMITDSLEMTSLYNEVNPLFQKSFDFIKTLSAESPNGSYEIAPGLMAHVMEYETGESFQYGWEAHQKYIDIQYCLRGKERIQWTPLSEKLIPSIEYDAENDRTFFKGLGENTFIDTGDGIFALFFPNDAHAPQLCTDKPEFIKKVVVKVPVSK